MYCTWDEKKHKLCIGKCEKGCIREKMVPKTIFPKPTTKITRSDYYGKKD